MSLQVKHIDEFDDEPVAYVVVDDELEATAGVNDDIVVVIISETNA